MFLIFTPCVFAATPSPFDLQQLQQGLKFYQAGRVEQARKKFLAVSAQAGDGYSAARLYLARIAFEQGQLDVAVEVLTNTQGTRSLALHEMLESERTRVAQACLRIALDKIENDSRSESAHWVEKAKRVQPKLAQQTLQTVDTLLELAQEMGAPQSRSFLGLQSLLGWSSNRNYSPEESLRESGTIASLAFTGILRQDRWGFGLRLQDDEWVNRPSERSMEQRAWISYGSAGFRVQPGIEYRHAFSRPLKWSYRLGVSYESQDQPLNPFVALSVARSHSLRDSDPRWTGNTLGARFGGRGVLANLETEAFVFTGLEHLGSFTVGGYTVPDDGIFGGVGAQLLWTALRPWELELRGSAQLRMSQKRIEPGYSIRRDFQNELELNAKRLISDSVRILAEVHYTLLDSNLENLQIADYDFKEWTLQAGIEVRLTK